MNRSRPIRLDAWPSDNNGSESLMSIACPECSHPLEIHQPDQNLPSRLLGICALCQVWLLIDIDGEGQTRTFKLPRPPGN
jgi:hypothetical protein